ncbi:peroxisomal N(1)-acetyl-spermine/spermidine oxidase-like isoform X2 [Scyliorhinus canicula]|nr:peroxisomal N(1)-acetyl-spermine/spermidine oxidase-like isoform X2 [Scyliorhinus canicula]
MKNPIFRLATEYGLLQEALNNSGTDWSVFTNTQKQLGPDFVEKLRSLSTFLHMQADLQIQNNTQLKSIWDVCEVGINELIKNWTDDSPTVRSQKLGWLNLVMKNESAVFAVQSLHDVSLQQISEREYFEGGDRYSPGFFPKLISSLKEDIPREKLLLEKPVKQIQWNGNFESYDGSTHPIRVVCEDGDSFLADHVIVTVSLGYLKGEAETMFHPTLPAEKLNAIKSLGFGTVNKVFLEYEVPFWENSQDWIGLLWENETPFSGLKPNIAEWWQRIYSFYMLNQARFGHMLLTWSSGREAEFMETLSEEEIASNITSLLRQFMGRPVPRPKHVFMSKWFSNPYIRGSYSHVSINSTGDMFDTLAEPLPQEKGDGHLSEKLQVLFAGEATQRRYHSTTHGALLSGWREADRLINHYSIFEGQQLQTKQVACGSHH